MLIEKIIFNGIRILIPVLALVSPVIATTHDVDPDGSGDYPDIQSAITAAAPADTVLLLPGTYTGVGNRLLDFDGKDIVLLGRDGPENTIIDCEYQEVAFYFHSNETALARVQGLTITQGSGNVVSLGASILCNDASPTLTDLIIQHGEADGGGAGMYLRDSSSLVDDIRFLSNTAGMGGGGIKVSHCSPTIRNCYFSGNIAYNQGGAIYISTNSDPFIEDCIFEDSGAGYEGGAIYMVAIAPTIRRCDFVRNEGRRGGAIYIGEAAPHILDCTFAGNHTFGAGGTLFFNIDPPEGQAVIESCLFHENTGLYGGTGIVCTEGAKPLLSNLTIVGNYGSTMNGAGISSFVQANPVIENCIVANNDGPGIYVGGTADVTINCSNVVGNTEGDYYGNILNQTGLNGNISEAPLFCDYDNWVLTLAEQSPCLPENNDCGVLMGALGMDCTLTDVSEVPGYGVQLLPCFPNPFNPHTTISLHVEDPAMVRITIHDVTGRQIRILHEGWHEAGHRDLTWNGLDEAGKDAPSGIYFVVLDGPAGRSSQKITLLR